MKNLRHIMEIKLTSSYDAVDYESYDDSLVISRNKIFYRRNRKKDKKEISFWSYDTNSNILESISYIIFSCLKREFSSKQNLFHEKSPFKFSICVSYDDETKEKIDKIGTFLDNNMRLLAIQFLNIVPYFELYPDVISIFRSEYLNSNTFSRIKKSDITAVMYAEAGAMGCAGSIEVITKDNFRYYTDGIYGRPTDVSQMDVIKLLHDYEPILGLGKKYEYLKINNENWLYLRLGAGNHLILKDDLFFEIGNLILDQGDANIYQKWKHLSKNNLLKNKCNLIEIDGDALETECDILCHQVNLEGVMGGGIALSIARKFPGIEERYSNYDKKALGEVYFEKTDNYVVANCFSQTEEYKTDYDALKKCLDRIVAYLYFNHLKSVAIPYKYGCGIANGDWKIVKSIFVEKLKDYTLMIYKLK